MCLSDAYEIRDGKENLVCSRVCNVSADGENVTLTDLMGIRKIIPQAERYFLRRTCRRRK